MRVLSLFDGISCGMVALKRAGIPIDKYVAYEIDEDAIKVSQDNYPEIIQKGNVFEAEYKEGEYDLLIGGSPCTYWSIANGKNRETTSSGLGFELFEQYVRALREVKPKYFLYENNKSMSNDIKEEITKYLGVEPVMIDSADFSPQMRKRYYWTNIPIDKDYIKNNQVIQDIIYDEPYKPRDFEKYKDTIITNDTNTILRYDTSGKGYYSQSNRCRKPCEKMTTITTTASACNIWVDKYKLRKINPIEAERLQTLPDNYTSCLKAKGKRIKAIGNGWTVNVIAHIFKGLKAIDE